MTLEVRTSLNSDLIVIAAQGELDYDNFRTLRGAIDGALDQGIGRVLLDLSRIDYLDSAALGSLLHSQKLVHEHGGAVTLLPSGALIDVLRLTHLDSHFDLCTSLVEGVERLATSPASGTSKLASLGDFQDKE